MRGGTQILKTATLWHILLCGLSAALLWQPAHGRDEPLFTPTFVEKAPVIDGSLNEDIWATAFEAKGLRVIEPDTGEPGSYQTRIRMAYDKEALYLGVISEQPADTHVLRISARDRKWIGRDAIRVVLDPTGQGRYGYLFEVALGGTLSDGTIQPEWRYSLDWDGPWLAATSVDEHHWYAEIEIPWDIMEWPAKKEKRRIGVYVRRQVSHLGEYWAVPPIPFNASVFLSDLAKMEVLGVNPKGRLTFYPYIKAGYDGMSQKRKESVGTDVFWQPSSNLLISATVNPDFGQVENDKIVVNFGPTETLFQEKRPFFLEGSDIFAAGDLNMVHTRRIGAPADEPDLPANTEVTQRPPISDILTAVKVTGQNRNLRYGLMTALEDESDFAISDGSEVSVRGKEFYTARALHERRGTGSGYTAIGYLGTLVRDRGEAAWAHSIDAQWQSSDSRYRLETQAAMSDVLGERGYAWNGKASYSPESGTEYQVDLDYLDDKFNIDDMGYMERNDRLKFDGSYRKYHYDMPGFRRRSYSIRAKGEVNDHLLSMRVQGVLYLKFHNLTTLMTELRYMPETWDDLSSFGHAGYRRKEGYRLSASWTSDQSKPFSVYISARAFPEDNGGISKRLGLASELAPLDMCRIHSSISYYDREDWILHRSGDEMNGFDTDQLTFSLDSDIRLTAKQKLRLGLQWVGLDARGETAYRIDADGYLTESGEEVASQSFDYAEFSGQIRYKYEFAPLSDLFVVYSRGGLVYWGADSKKDDLGDLLSDSLEERDVDRILIKIRYRF